jgi:hypothetical protein
VARLSGSTVVRPAPAGATWTWLLLLVLVAALAIHAARSRIDHGWATLAIDLPWAGFALALLGLAARVRRGWWPAPTDAGRSRAARIAALALGGLALAAFLAPAVARGGRAGLTVGTARTWGVIDPGPTVRIGVPPAALEEIPAGAAPFLVASGWLYAPSAGHYGFSARPPGPVTLWIDGSPIVVIPPAPEVEPVVGVDRGTYRESTVRLGRGFHRLDVWYPAGSTPRPRWRLPYAEDALRLLPVDHLLATDTTPGDRLLRARALAARRWGVLGLATLALLAVAAAAARVAPEIAGPRRAGLTAAGHAALALVFFTLTETSLLFWPGQVDALRPALLVGIPAAVVAGLAFARVRAPGRPGPGGGPRAWPAGARTGLALLALLAVQVALVVRFLVFVDGRLPLPGDHSSFLYRYHVLLHALPRLRSYDPWWNAGTADPSAAISGAASTLALFWPLLWIGPLERVYAAFIPLVGAGLVPWCLFAATRLLGGSALAAFLAGLLALAPDETYFWWFMAHGTLPAAISAALATLTVALAWRVVVRRDPRRWLALVLALCVTLGLYWALFALMVGPALLAFALVHRRRLGRRELLLALGIALALFLAHAHWLVGIAGAARGPYTATIPVREVPWRRYLATGVDTLAIDPSPLALVLGCIGLLLLPRPLRWAHGAFVASLLVSATLVRPLFPRLELERFFTPLSLALIPPAAWLAARLLRAALRREAATAPALGLAVVALLAVHADGVWRQYSGDVRRGASQMEFESAETRRLVEWLRAAPAGDGRILLGGELVGPGRLGGGYAAFLQPLSGRPLVGHHQNVKVVDLDMWGLLGTGDLRQTIELLNVRYALIREDWLRVRARFEETPGMRLHERLPGGFLVYETPVTSGYLIGARGTVAFDRDRLDVRLDEPVTSPVTLKFRWVPGLVAAPPVRLEPVEVRPGVRFIRAHPAGVREFRIGYVDCCWWHPAEMWARWRSRA